MTNTLTKPRRIIPWFAAAALLEFLIYYLLTLFADDYNVIYYYVSFVERFILLAIPVFSAAMLIRLDRGIKGTIIAITLISLTRAIVFIPFFYLEYVYGPYDSVESIALSLLTTVVTVIIHLLITLLVWWVMRMIISASIRHGIRHGKLSSDFPVPYLHFDNGITLSISAISFVIFAINFIIEIISTVRFFIENGTIYYTNEIVLMIFSYVYLIILFLGIHFGACFLANKCVKQVAASEIEE